jgi:uncharacterized protein (DUF2062 family)
VALSIFLGVFIGVMPTIGIAVVLTVAILALFKLPKLPGIIASFIAIPPTLFLFFYPVGYVIGLRLVDPPPSNFLFLEKIHGLSWANFTPTITHLWINAQGHVIAFVVGITIVAILTGFVCATISFYVMEFRRARRLRFPGKTTIIRN